MSSDDYQILKDFQAESKTLIEKMTEVLDRCEGDIQQVQGLEEYGQTVDRIIGGAKSLAMGPPYPLPMVNQIGDYAAICKAVGYKASQIRDNEAFYNICVALLQDATEVLADLVDHVFDREQKGMKTFINQAFIDRLKWVSEKFGSEYRATLDSRKTAQAQKMNQGEIDELMKKLGLD
jgi:hypothetical protein